VNPRYRDEFRRHRIRYLLPVVLTTLLAIWYVAGKPAAYQSGASLWVDTPAPEASSLTQTDQFAVTPASQAQELLNELLTTRQFRLEVGRHGPLAGYLASHSSFGFGPSALLAQLHGKQSTDNLVVGALGPKQVVTTVAGPQVLAITVTGPTATVALGTTRALVSAFNEARTTFDLQRAQATVAYYRNQATVAGDTLRSTETDIQGFAHANPGVDGSGQTPQDAQLRTLMQAERVARSRYNAANRAANQASLNFTAAKTDKSSFKVLDPPTLPTGPVSGKKKALMAVIGGLFAGALLSFLALVAFGGGPGDPDREDALGVPVPFTREGRMRTETATAATSLPVAEQTPPPEVAEGGG
jgi:hypothetical protein